MFLTWLGSSLTCKYKTEEVTNSKNTLTYYDKELITTVKVLLYGHIAMDYSP
jgi:hypothetical protein